MTDRFLITDDRDKELRKIAVRMTRSDIGTLANVLRKIHLMCENPQPTIPDLTDNELELVEVLWKTLELIR